MLLTVLALLTVSTTSATAEEARLTFLASVDRTRVDLDDHLALTISVSGSDLGGIPEPQLASLEGFEIVGTNRSSSSQFTLVNGKMTSSKTIDYLYTLRPQKTGTLTIGSATLDFKGTAYRTDPIEVEVVGGSVSGRSQPQTQGPAPPAPAAPEDLSTEDLFVRVELDRRTVYPGQQVTATYTLYNRSSLTNVQYDQVPSFTGFWVEEIYDAERLNFQEQVIGGKRYQVAVLKKLALFPTTSGTIELEPLQMVCDLRLSGRDLFDFFGRSKRVRISSQPVTITVNPLPQEGKPANFSGAVGQFTMKASLDHSQIGAGEPVELTVEIRGEGNLKTLLPPSLPALDDFKTFDPEVKESISKTGGRIGGSKTYRYVLIPKKEGEYRIGSLALNFFDPEKSQYRTTGTDGIDIRVLPGQQEEIPLTVGLGKEEIRVLGKDIRYIKPASPGLRDQGNLLYRRTIFQIIQAIPLLAILVAALARRRRNRLSGDVCYARRRRAMKASRKCLQIAEKLVDETSTAQFYGALSKALYDYVADKLNLAAGGLTSQGLRQELTGREVDEKHIQELMDCLSACDFSRFAPGGDREQDRRIMLKRVRDLISRLERTGL